MEVDKGARNLAATKELRVEQHTARPMGEGGGASSLDALRVQRERRTSALLMVGVVGVLIQGAPKQPVANPGCVSGMVEERGAW